jgi:plasmid stabilization system protein ParE
MTELRVRPEAELDAFEAALWYESERKGLGAAFLQTMRRLFERIMTSPLQFPLVSADVRRAMMARYPFGVFFYVEEKTTTVIAVMHLHREPATWERRR